MNGARVGIAQSIANFELDAPRARRRAQMDRPWIATILTAQIAGGAALGIAAQVFLVWVIIGYVMPFFGLELLGMARDMAAFNLPARAIAGRHRPPASPRVEHMTAS